MYIGCCSMYCPTYNLKWSSIKNPENVCFADFANTFAYKIYPEHGLKNPELRENPENFHLCGSQTNQTDVAFIICFYLEPVLRTRRPDVWWG